jgi:hypothetical protein
MMDQHEDPKFNEWLQNAAKGYHTPPATPREKLWARIVAEQERRARRVIELRPWMRWALAAAAVLAVGIGIGRWSAPDQLPVNGTPLVSNATADSISASVIYQVAATQYLSRTETFLTGFRSDVRQAAGNVRFANQARDLLSTTRLMLDSPMANDTRLRALLEDLELVLVQISQLPVDRETRDADLITQSIDQSNVLPKLRSAIPAGPVPVRTEGAL